MHVQDFIIFVLTRKCGLKHTAADNIVICQWRDLERLHVWKAADGAEVRTAGSLQTSQVQSVGPVTTQGCLPPFRSTAGRWQPLAFNIISLLIHATDFSSVDTTAVDLPFNERFMYVKNTTVITRALTVCADMGSNKDTCSLAGRPLFHSATLLIKQPDSEGAWKELRWWCAVSRCHISLQLWLLNWDHFLNYIFCTQLECNNFI